MRKFLLMLLAVLFCTSALCTIDVFAKNDTSDKLQTSTTTDQNSVSNEKSPVTNTKKGTCSAEEVYLVAKLVYHEAHNQSYDGKVAIAEVVLNRLRSSLFPDSVEEVLFQKGQFTSRSGLKNIVPEDEEIEIAENVLNGSLRVFDDPSVMYFRNPKITSGISADKEKNWGKLKYFTYIGEHAFYSQVVNDDDLGDNSMSGVPTDAKLAIAEAKKTKKSGATAKDEAADSTEGVAPVPGGELEVSETDLSEEQIAAMQQTKLQEAMQEAMQAEAEMKANAQAAAEAAMTANTQLAHEMQAAARAAAEADMEAKTQEAIRMQQENNAQAGNEEQADILVQSEAKVTE